MQTVALIGFLGGLITGISPCILPIASGGVLFRRPSGESAQRLPIDSCLGSVLMRASMMLVLATLTHPNRSW
jgi:cytochrome c biogenesis protein CcdA